MIIKRLYKKPAEDGAYCTRMEFISAGGLLPGIGLDDVMEGLSVCRNPNLANIFYRLQLIEVYGTGMRKIMAAYADLEQKPVIKISTNAFKIILPNVNHEGDATTIAAAKRDDEDKVLTLLRNSGAVTRIDVEEQLGVSASAAPRLLRYMVEKGMLTPVGRARSTKYILAC